MTSLGYHCSHEQYAPSALLENAKLAFQGGFRHAMCSDHFYPWIESQGQSGFAWSWLGAALEATGLSFGTVCAPGQRYHPAVIAQAGATLAEMYPERFWVSLGSGEALNECIAGEWMPKTHRQQRLKECADIMRSLWNGQTVTHHGLVDVKGAKLYSRPAKPPMLIGACLSPDTAEWMGSWVDGIITITQDRSRMQEIVSAFHSGGGRNKPMFLQVVLSFASTDDEALHAAFDQWRQAALSQDQLADLDSPAAFERAASGLTPADVAGKIRISSDVKQQLDWLLEDAEMGFERLYLHNVHREQARFISAFSEHVLPRFS